MGIARHFWYSYIKWDSFKLRSHEPPPTSSLSIIAVLLFQPAQTECWVLITFSFISRRPSLNFERNYSLEWNFQSSSQIIQWKFICHLNFKLYPKILFIFWDLVDQKRLWIALNTATLSINYNLKGFYWFFFLKMNKKMYGHLVQLKTLLQDDCNAGYLLHAGVDGFYLAICLFWATSLYTRTVVTRDWKISFEVFQDILNLLCECLPLLKFK